MKPNDKALNESLSVTQIPEENMREYMRRVLTAAYAAQFQSDDYAGLVEELRDASHCHQCVASGEKAADAIEALLAERDALKAANSELREENELVGKQMDKFADQIEALEAERDALLARLAPEDDEALVEIGARAICLVKCELAFRCKDDGFCKAPVGNFRDPNYVRTVSLGSAWRQSRAAIAAIRPHIEAVEREQFVKAVEKVAEKINVPLHERHEWEDGYLQGVYDAAAAIRSGK